jgi:hypothetical protein
MIRRLATSGALIGAVALALAGCGSSGSNSPSGTTANVLDDPAVAWAEQVCKVVSSQAATLSQPPNIDPTNPAKTKDGYVEFLSRLSKAVGVFADGIKNAGTPPVANGQTAADTAVATLVDGKKSIDAAISKAKATPVTDPASLAKLQTALDADLAKSGDAKNPVNDLKANPALEAAFAKAPTCQKLDASTSGSTAPTS